MRVRPTVLAASALGIILTAVTALPAGAAARPAPDINDDGRDELIIGVPSESHEAAPAAANLGLAEILFGATGGIATSGNDWMVPGVDIPGAIEADAEFGSAFAYGDFDNDGYDDLAVGSPGADSDAGTVTVIHGSASGLNYGRVKLWTQDSKDIKGASATGDRFGAYLAAGNFGKGPQDDLAIASPEDSVNGDDSAGVVNVIYGSSNGLRPAGNQVWNQDSDGISDSAEPSDNFGQVLASGNFGHGSRDDLAVGVFGEDLENDEAGAVNVIYGGRTGLSATNDQRLTQVTAGVGAANDFGDGFGGALTAGDFGDGALDELAVGAAGETISGFDNGGAVYVFRGNDGGFGGAGNTVWSQNTVGIADSAETSDRFGDAIAAGDVAGAPGYADLVVGVSDEDSAGTGDGIVQIIPGSASGLTSTGSSLWSQNIGTIQDSAETTDYFGRSIMVGDFDGINGDDLAVAAHGEDLPAGANAGAINVILNTGAGLGDAGNLFITQDTLGVSDIVEADDFFGEPLGQDNR